MLKHGGQEGHAVPQVGLNPDVRESVPVACVGGPCDGQLMRCPEGFVLIVTRAVDGPRATALPATIRPVAIAREVGGYHGHYERQVDTLTWHPDESPRGNE